MGWLGLVPDDLNDGWHGIEKDRAVVLLAELAVYDASLILYPAMLRPANESETARDLLWDAALTV